MQTVARKNNRPADRLRPFDIELDIQPQAYSSLLISSGDTKVICAVSLEEAVPPFLENSGRGWITAEYSMLPCATSSRNRREVAGRSGRSMEIQRLIGRSLRMMLDLTELDGYTLRVDCDVLNADGGTRTASITGAALLLQRALGRMSSEGRISGQPHLLPLAAVSVGIVEAVALLDLDYEEDARAEADGNFVMAGGNWVEVQVTAEKHPLAEGQFLAMQTLARKGIDELLNLWHGET